MPRKALQLPFRSEESSKVGHNLFRKQILPLGKIEHANGTLDVTPEYVADLAANFNGGAFDQVAFLLANESNDHHMDPERFRGEVKGVEVGEDGLYGLVELTDDGAKVVADNPRLGVSARIIEAARDGKDAIQHVLGTLDPRAKGMGSWEQVELSEDDAEVVDLTEAEYSPPVTPPATTETSSTEATELSPEDAERILNGMVDRSESTPTPEAKPAELSEDARKAIELATRNANAADQRARKAEERVATAEFEAERRELEAAGVPPFMLDLAAPVLTAEPGTIELSNGSKVDPAQILREILNQSRGLVDLSEAVGVGSGEPGSQEAEAKEAVKQWEKQSTGVRE